MSLACALGPQSFVLRYGAIPARVSRVGPKDHGPGTGDGPGTKDQAPRTTRAGALHGNEKRSLALRSALLEAAVTTPRDGVIVRRDEAPQIHRPEPADAHAAAAYRAT